MNGERVISISENDNAFKPLSPFAKSDARTNLFSQPALLMAPNIDKLSKSPQFELTPDISSSNLPKNNSKQYPFLTNSAVVVKTRFGDKRRRFTPLAASALRQSKREHLRQGFTNRVDQPKILRSTVV